MPDSPTPTRIVIADCDHESFEPELEVARELGIDLVIDITTGEREFLAAARGAVGVLMQYATIDGRVLDAMPGVRAIGRYGVGVDTVDIPAATARGIAVCNVPDYGTESVSDHAIALTLALVRGIVRFDRGVRQGSSAMAPARPLFEITGRTFGVLGMGAIGSATARKAAGIGYRVIGYDPSCPAGSLSRSGVLAVSLEELLTSSHVVSVHMPLTTETHHFVDAAKLALMRADAILVNTSRGGIVDTNALVDALNGAKISGAGLDVFEREPLAVDHPLVAMENVVLTPHAAWYTEESEARLKRTILENVIAVCAGRAPRNILNPEVLGASGVGGQR